MDKVDDTQYCGYVIDFVNKKHMGRETLLFTAL